ncbi:MAG: aminopeptidase [Clostridia bacterium]|nr:aminopeptidase [Clostridia bacterium]
MDLKYEKKNIHSTITEKEISMMKKYSKEYMKFLNEAKTEYLCVEYAIELLTKNNFVDINTLQEIKEGDKVYFINKEKSLYVAVIGKDALTCGVNIIGAHIDSPRLDIKPMPLYEKQNVALLKTQYYGGIKKYQWLAIPLAMHGVIYNEKNEKVVVSAGEEDDDFCFTITDLLPHLSRDQMKLSANEFIDPEKMSVLFGSIQDRTVKKDKIKENILKVLYRKYGIKEIDFARSEICFVPSFKAKYVGIDESLIGGYGQDDRVCAYSTLKAIVDIANKPDTVDRTMIAMIVDKEETGSYGNTSMSSLTFDMFMNRLINMSGEDADLLEIYFNSKMLSADVSTCVDPCYEEVSDIQNSNTLNCGVSLEKYTGSGGKYSSSDANASYMSEIMNLFDREKIVYQLGTLGKIEKGGGGTIAYILANKGVNVVDCGTPILSMHSPFEVASEADIYMTYKAYVEFFRMR